MRIAYFTNQYPAVSHTFIRREIQALETLDVSVVRFALQPGGDLVDDEDKAELAKTSYVLSAHLSEILRCCITVLLSQPKVFISCIRQALLMGWRSESGI